MTTQELVRIEQLLPAEPIGQIAALKTAFAKLAGQCNLVSPIVQIDSILPMHKVSMRAVVIDPFVNPKGMGPEVYKADFCENNERALGKVGVTKVLSAAGVQVLATTRLDDRSDPYYCEFAVTLALRDLDGQWRQDTKTKAVDLRDGSAAAQKFTAGMLRQQREHILSLAESKAMLRAARTLLNLKAKYTVEELGRPFVIPKLVAALDPSDPDQKKALIELAAQGDRVLFGAPPADPMRSLKDVTPSTPALPAARDAESPVEPTNPASAAANDFELLPDVEPEPKAQDQLVCWCPCGCKRAITAEASTSTIEAVGAPRCRACYPGKGFDPAMHEGIGDLELPKKPGLTAERVTASVIAATKAAGK
jgi:hypothetical protein